MIVYNHPQTCTYHPKPKLERRRELSGCRPGFPDRHCLRHDRQGGDDAAQGRPGKVDLFPFKVTSLGSGVPYLNTFFWTCSIKEPL